MDTAGGAATKVGQRFQPAGLRGRKGEREKRGTSALETIASLAPEDLRGATKPFGIVVRINTDLRTCDPFNLRDELMLPGKYLPSVFIGIHRWLNCVSKRTI
jgi:hypothetical protein